MSKCRRPRGAGVSAKSGQVQTQGSKIGQNVRRPECKIPTNNTDIFDTSFSVYSSELTIN